MTMALRHIGNKQAILWRVHIGNAVLGVLSYKITTPKLNQNTKLFETSLKRPENPKSEVKTPKP